MVPIIRWLFLLKLCGRVHLWETTQPHAVNTGSKCKIHTAAITTNTHLPLSTPTIQQLSHHWTPTHPPPPNPISLLSTQRPWTGGPSRPSLVDKAHWLLTPLNAHTHARMYKHAHTPLLLHCISLRPKRRERRDFAVFHLKICDSSSRILFFYYS